MNIEIYLFIWCVSMLGMIVFGTAYRYMDNYKRYWQQKIWDFDRCNQGLIFTRDCFDTDEEYHDYVKRMYQYYNDTIASYQAKIDEWNAKAPIHIAMRIACMIAMLSILGFALWSIQVWM